MLTIKRLISALFIVFFVSWSGVAMGGVKCPAGKYGPTTLTSDANCITCEAGYFCTGGDVSLGGTRAYGKYDCANVLRGSTSDEGAKSAGYCYRTMNGREYITKTTYIYDGKNYFYEVSDCPSGKTSVCASGTVVSYADIKNSDTYCECVAPEEIVNLYWYDGFGDGLPTDAFVNAVKNDYPTSGIVNRALTLPASPYVTQDGLFNGWGYGGQIYNGEIPADSFTKSGDIYMYSNFSDNAMAVDFKNILGVGPLPSLSPDVEYSAADDNTVRLILEKGNCAPVYFDAEKMIDPDFPEDIFVGWGFVGYRDYARNVLYFFDGTPGYYCADGNKYSEKKLNLEPVFYTPQFVIRYDKNAAGATGTMTDESCYAGSSKCLLSENTFEYTGYTFSGWDAKLTRRVLPLYAGPNDEIKGSSYNKFVQREQNLGVLSAGADVVEYAKQITEIPFSTIATGSMLTMTAQWTPNTYTITFNPETGDGVSTENVDFDSALPETIVTPSRLGYSFGGYYNGSEQYYDATGARQVETYTTASDVTLTAQWTPNTYTITFNPETGDGVSAENVDFDSALPETIVTPSRLGYSFGGYYNGSEQYYDATGARQVETYTTASDLELTAQWTPNSFTITYDGNGATGEMSPTTCTYDQSCFVADNAFTKTDYKFAGWKMTDGTPVAVGADFTNKTAVANDNIILVAQWSLDTLDCQMGKYYDGTDFVDCPAGQYCPGTGTVTVGMAGCGVACPLGYDAATGAESQEDCAIYVPAGSYLANARDASPTDCPLGHHCPGNVIVNYGNTSEIYGCNEYRYADVEGLAECKTCPDITKGALIEAAQKPRNDDGVRDSINDCAYAFTFAAPEYVDAWGFTPPDSYDAASPLNQRGQFTVNCQYNSDTKDYDTNCYANFVGYCADGYYSPQSQDAATYNDAQNVMYENINLKTLEKLPCQPVESDLGFVSPGIDTDAPTSDDTYFKSLQQQCKPADNEIGAAIVMTDSRYGFGGSEKTCAAVYQFAFAPMDEKYAPKPNIRGLYVTRCLYNKSTGEYNGGCQTNVIYCDSGYYAANVELAPDSGDITDEMILSTDTVEQAVEQACVPVGNGHFSPGYMQCLIEQGINPEEVTYENMQDINQGDPCFTAIQNLGVEYISQHHDCPNGGSTGTDTAYSITQCFKSDVKCNDDNGGTGVQTCYYNEDAGDYTDCRSNCEITQCPAGKYMDDNGCVPCPAGFYCTNNTKTECPEHSSSFGSASSCACNSGYELPNGDSNNVTTDACSPTTYTVTYRDEDGGEIATDTATFDAEYTTSDTQYPKLGYTQVGWNVKSPQSYWPTSFVMGAKFIYNVTENMELRPKYEPNKFNLIFQDGDAYNAGDYTLPKGIATYGEPLPDISGFGTIELRLLELETGAGQRHMKSDGWTYDDTNKMWDADGKDTGNYTYWSDYFDLPSESGDVEIKPYWTTFELRCNPGYYIPAGKVGNKSCAICLRDQACPGWSDFKPVGSQYGMFKCPDNSFSNERSAYCTCYTGFSADGMENGKTELSPTIGAGFGDQSCKKITLYYNYDFNGGEGTLEPTAVEYGETAGPISDEEIGTQMTRAGYVFVGWGEEPEASESYDWQNAPMTSSKKLYAIWKACESGTYKGADAAAGAECTQCPDSHPNTDDVASTNINQCYVECPERTDVVGGVGFRDNDKAYHDNVCTYSHGEDENGNKCDVIEDVCVHTDCEPEYEMIDGHCKPCARKYALSYNPIGNCRVESCIYGYHPNNDQCEKNVVDCTDQAPNAVAAERVWNSATNSFGACVITKCEDGFHVDANACVSDTRVCKIENGIGKQLWDAKRNRWGDCVVTRCEPGYTNDHKLTNERWKDCGRCNNMFGIDGDVAVSSYITECDIATCMYQGEKYILEDNECRLICGEYSDETGDRYWDDKEYECKHKCNPGYLPW